MLKYLVQRQVAMKQNKLFFRSLGFFWEISLSGFCFTTQNQIYVFLAQCKTRSGPLPWDKQKKITNCYMLFYCLFSACLFVLFCLFAFVCVGGWVGCGCVGVCCFCFVWCFVCFLFCFSFVLVLFVCEL